MMGTFDPARRRLVLYGGDDGVPQQCSPAPHAIDELWTYDVDCGSFAQRSSQGGPGGRARGLAVHDPLRDRMILFGGRFRSTSSGPYRVFNDVWSLALETFEWQKLTTSGGPPTARSNPTGAYNPATDELVLFGGNSSTSGLTFTPLDDVWALGLETLRWRRIATQPGPAARLFHTAALDPDTGTLYVYGGGDAGAFTGPFFGDLWALDLGTGEWTELHGGGGPSAPRGRIWSTLAFDGARGRLLLFAGHDDGEVGNNNDTWAFALGVGTWSAIVPPETVRTPANGFCDFPADFTEPNREAPDRRSAHLAALDEARGEWVIFGGKTDCGIINDVWSFGLEPGTWRKLYRATAGEACLRWGTTCNTLCN
jgi:hypothetical protein